jgi:hypothetical protein
MSSVKRPEACFSSFLLLIAVWVFFLSVRFRRLKRFPGDGNGVSRCSSCYPCTAPQGRHQLTHTVTARKRTRPISESGRGRPQFRSGRVPFQSFWIGSWHGLRWSVLTDQCQLDADHLPPQVSGLDPPGTPAPEIHGHLPRDRHHGFLAGGAGRFGVGHHRPPFFD